MYDPILKMKHHGLGTPGIKPVSTALVVIIINSCSLSCDSFFHYYLKTNTKVVKLDVSDNWLGKSTGTFFPISWMFKYFLCVFKDRMALNIWQK